MRPCLALLAGLLVTAAAATAAPASSVTEPWTPEPWLSDLKQLRQVLNTQYANRDWLLYDREVDLDALFEATALRLRSTGSDADARAAFDRLLQRLGDGHISIQWPRPDAAASSTHPVDVCTTLGYDARQNAPGIASKLPNFHPVGNTADSFTAGIVKVGAIRLGVIRIGVFHPHGTPELCHAAFAELNLPKDKPCDESCADAVLTWTYDRLTASLQSELRALKAAGAQQLLVDISGNGGGSEWVEATARMVSSRPLQSARWGFVRGEHWTKQWRELADRLRTAATDATPADRTQLLAWAAEADDARRAAEQSCIGRSGCEWAGRAGFATGLVGSAKAGTFDGKPWGVHVFSPAQYHYEDGVWSGPVVVLVDEHTGSAAEEFAAILQDNHAAIIMGARTAGAGCGYTGSAPITLEHSRATLRVPDCIRFRADGWNEVNGVIPDVLVGMRVIDGPKLKMKLLQAKLPEALKLAAQLDRAK
jgi:hypothetical protein